MSKLTSHEVRLASRPEGIPAATNFTLVRTELEPLQDREVLVRNLFMSVDPYMRGRMNEGQSYVPPFELGKPLDGGAVGEVVESRANEFRVGDAVTSSRGWREYFIAAPEELHPVNREIQPLSVYLGALGMTGMTAWAGLNLVDVKAGDVIFISGAAGAVGNVAGQLAKLRRCRVVGSASSRIREGSGRLFRSGQAEEQGNGRERNRPRGGCLHRPVPRAKHRQDGGSVGLSHRVWRLALDSRRWPLRFQRRSGADGANKLPSSLTGGSTEGDFNVYNAVCGFAC